MIKRIALAIACLSAAVGVGYRAYPEEFKEYLGMTSTAAQWAWDGVRANPFPVSLALGTFLLTVIYHKAKGKSLRESVEVAATRVTLVPVPLPVSGSSDEENTVVRRARARAMRTQLLADQNGIENRQRKLPEEILKAEKDACYAEQALADAEWKLSDKQKAHDDAVAKLETLRKEKARSDSEIAEIQVELKKLSEVV